LDNLNAEDYIKLSQQFTSYDLKDKFVEKLTNDVIVSVNYNDLSLSSSSINRLIDALPDIITNDVEGPGQYELDIYKVIVNKKEEKRPKLKLC